LRSRTPGQLVNVMVLERELERGPADEGRDGPAPEASGRAAKRPTSGAGEVLTPGAGPPPGGGPAPNPRIFLLSPASCSGERAQLVFGDRARFDLARRLRTPAGAPLGEVFSFLSGLYFRGKLAYGEAFARPPAGLPGVLVITPCRGLRPPAVPITLEDLRRFREVSIDSANAAYRRPLVRDARVLATALRRQPGCEVVLLGSVATGKYHEVLAPVLGEQLRFPVDFVGRGDMSRGGLLLRCVDAAQELPYAPFSGTALRGPRPARLLPRRTSR
jgi:hypothetical protein